MQNPEIAGIIGGPQGPHMCRCVRQQWSERARGAWVTGAPRHRLVLSNAYGVYVKYVAQLFPGWMVSVAFHYGIGALLGFGDGYRSCGTLDVSFG